LRLIDSCITQLSLRLKDLLGPVTRVKKKKSMAYHRPACFVEAPPPSPRAALTPAPYIYIHTYIYIHIHIHT